MPQGQARQASTPEEYLEEAVNSELTVGDVQCRPLGYRLGTDGFCKACKISHVLCKDPVSLQKRSQKQKPCQDLCYMNAEDIGGGGGIEF